jgi:hypothetical protein
MEMKKNARPKIAIPRVRRRWAINPRTRIKPDAKKYRRSQAKKQWPEEFGESNIS